MTISDGEMPSLVTLVCAAAGRQVSTTTLTARPNALNDFDIDVSSPKGPCWTKGEGHRSSACLNGWLFFSAHAPCRETDSHSSGGMWVTLPHAGDTSPR